MIAWLHSNQWHVASLLCRVNRDLGQFERFRRIFHTPYYSVLLSHLHYTPLSSLQVSKVLNCRHAHVHLVLQSYTGIICLPIQDVKFFGHGTDLLSGV